VKGHEPELPRGPDDDLLAQPREVDRDARRHEGELGDDVPRRRRVDRVLGGSGEAEIGGDAIRIETQRGPGERSGTVG